MGTIPHPCVDIHTTAASQPSLPPWCAEIVLIAGHLRSQGLLEALNAQVRLVRGRLGRYEVLDFLALLFGYALSGEQTLQAFFDRLHPFAEPFMALFERGMLPHRSTLSRFLAAVDSTCLEALRTMFATSSFVWGWTQETIGGLWDRSGQRYLVFDIDATREAARQRKLPTGTELPQAKRRLDALCGPGSTGLYGTPAWRSRAYPNHRVADAYPAMAGQFWWTGQWRLSRGVAGSVADGYCLSDCLGTVHRQRHCARGWPIW